MSHSPSTGPQPLAVRDLYTGRHKRARFHTPIKPEPYNADYFSYIASHFTINDQRPPAGTFEKAERTRDLYTELEADLSFLRQMRGVWEGKLAQLKMDFDMLQDMARAQPKDVDDLIDLDKRVAIVPQTDDEDQSSLHSQSISASKTPLVIPGDIDSTQLGYFDDDPNLMSMLSGDHEDMLWDEQEEDDNVTTEIPTTTSNTIITSDPRVIMEEEEVEEEEEEEEDNDIEEEEEEEIEDDEKARQALTLMLAEYGDQL